MERVQDPSVAVGWPTTSPTTLMVTDKANNTVSRRYYFSLPSGYDGTKPYPIVFAWHYLGGMASTIAGSGFSGHYYGVQPLFPNAIYVAPQGLTDASSGNTGFPNTNDQDIAFARAMASRFEGDFCVDKARLFSTGFSYGGMMSHTISCEMPDVFRALGIMSGIDIFNPSSCVNHGIAAWITHGDMDATLPFTSGETARDRIVAANHCGSATHPVDPSIDSGACVQPCCWFQNSLGASAADDEGAGLRDGNGVRSPLQPLWTPEPSPLGMRIFLRDKAEPSCGAMLFRIEARARPPNG